MARFVFVIINHALAFVAVDPALTKAASWPVQAKPASFAVGSEGHLPALNGGRWQPCRVALSPAFATSSGAPEKVHPVQQA